MTHSEGETYQYSKRGATIFAGIVVAFAAILAVGDYFALAYRPDGPRVLILIVATLLVPQYRTLDALDLPSENAPLLFLLSLVYLPILLAPTGIRLILPPKGPLWFTVVLQIAFVIGYLGLAAVLLITDEWM